MQRYAIGLQESPFLSFLRHRPTLCMSARGTCGKPSNCEHSRIQITHVDSILLLDSTFESTTFLAAGGLVYLCKQSAASRQNRILTKVHFAKIDDVECGAW